MADMELRNVKLVFDTPSGQRNLVYEDLNLKIDDGSFTVVLGPSGCGKSTLLNVLNGLLVPTSSDGIFVDGEDIRGRGTSARKMGYIFQSPRLLPWRTLRRNVEFGLRGLDIQPKDKWPELIDKYFEIVGLSQYVDYYPNQVSGGMQQRAAIVRAWANEPDVLLMDEPFSHLDEISAGELRRQLMSLWLRDERRRTVLFVTHNLLEAVLLGNRVVIMSKAPARICYEQQIELPWPRDPDDPEFLAIVKKLREILEREAGVRI